MVRVTITVELNLLQALVALYRARKIASPWLPGMLTTNGDRVINVQYPGPLPNDPIQFAGAFCRLGTDGDPERDRDWLVEGDEPDTTDPATLGCLVAILREATGDPGAGVGWSRWGAREAPRVWGLSVPLEAGEKYVKADTEGGAIANALIELAQDLEDTP